MILYADEDVDVLIKPLLKAKGFAVHTTLDEGMLGKTDREQLEHAISLKAAFLTVEALPVMMPIFSDTSDNLKVGHHAV